MDAIVALHGFVLGYLVVGVWAVVLFWSGALALTRYDETPTFWRFVSLAQLSLVVQLVVGLVLIVWWLVGDGRPPGGGGWFDGTFHLLYGIVFPFLVLLGGHGIARAGRYGPHAVFAVVGLVNFGLTARAFMVGAGTGG